MKVYCQVEDCKNYDSKGVCAASSITIDSETLCTDYEAKEDDDSE
jgi:hypothetical protein